MGVKHFYIWLRKNFSSCIHIQQNFIDKNIDNLCIDMNGVIHTCAQKVYEYGNHKPSHQRLLFRPKKLTLKNQLKLFDEITQHIDYLRRITCPKKRIIMCIDGVAGNAKMAQQRQRRFKSAKENEDK